MSSAEIEQASDARVKELTEALGEIRSRVLASPSSDILACYNLGQLDFGENYVNELVQKASVLPEGIRWHFIGSLQSNKCKTVAAVPNLYCLHTLDSIKKADALQKALPTTRKQPLRVMIQVNTSGEESKSGLAPISSDEANTTSEIVVLARHVIQSCPGLELHGLMTIGSYEASTAADGLNPDFMSLIGTRQALLTALQQDSTLGDAWGPDRRLTLSMGMSADFEEAIAAGSDMVRVGTGIFGSRPPKN